MADNLPPLPKKGGVCTDAGRVLREVFRELDVSPPGRALTVTSSAEYKKLEEHELLLQREYAKRIVREPLPNIHQLHSPNASRPDASWKNECGIIQRKDLRPSIKQDAGDEQCLWVQNILNKSSGELNPGKATGSRLYSALPLGPVDEGTVQSVSFGGLTSRPPPPSPLKIVSPALPNYVVCIPSKLEFVNFTSAELHTQGLRLINISKYEVRLSIRPPARRELDVEVCSRLTVTSGSAAELRVHFRPTDVRAFSDELLVRVSSGNSLNIPIACYMQPPLLTILAPGSASFPVSTTISMNSTSDTIDLGAKLLGNIHRLSYQLRSSARHASFFLLSEDSWQNYSVKISFKNIKRKLTSGVEADCFYVSPTRWCGGTRGIVEYRATVPGVHGAVLRVVSSTAIVRSLYLIADALVFSPNHITLECGYGYRPGWTCVRCIEQGANTR